MAGQVMEEVHHIVHDHRIACEQSEVLIELSVRTVVVARADVGVTAQTAVLVPDHQDGFRMRLQAPDAVGDVSARVLSSAAQWRFRSSSNRALISITQATCFPPFAARIDLPKAYRRRCDTPSS